MNLCEIRGTLHKNLPFDFESNSLETLMKIVDREGGFTWLDCHQEGAVVSDAFERIGSSERIIAVFNFSNCEQIYQ